MLVLELIVALLFHFFISVDTLLVLLFSLRLPSPLLLCAYVLLVEPELVLEELFEDEGLLLLLVLVEDLLDQDRLVHLAATLLDRLGVFLLFLPLIVQVGCLLDSFAVEGGQVARNGVNLGA